MLKFECDSCEKELEEPGALLFAPPETDTDLCVKYHICKLCFYDMVRKCNLVYYT